MVDEARLQRAERVVRLAEIAPGTRVIGANANGMAGTVVAVVPEETGTESGVRIAWADGNRTVVPLHTLTWRADMLVVGAGNAAMTTTATAVTQTAVTETAVRAERIADLRDGETFTVPVMEEILTADTVWREAGIVRLRVRGEAVPQTITREAAHEELYVEEVAVGRELTEGEQLAPRQEGDVLIVPIVEEEVVVTIRRVLAREARITRRTARESRTVDTTTRRTVVELDPGTLTERVHYPSGQAANRPL